MHSLKSYGLLVVIIALIVGGALWVANAADVRITVLWTDALIYLLIVAVAVFAIEAVHKEHLRAPWRHVVQRPQRPDDRPGPNRSALFGGRVKPTGSHRYALAPA